MMNLKLAGSKFTKISAERNTEFSGKLEIKTNIKNISLEKSKDAKDILRLFYSFEINYNELGKILVEGILFLSGDSKTVKELLKIQQDKNFKSPEYVAITNLIIQKASIKAFELEEELGLPIHIKLPTLSIKQ
ncbi:MAG: hypothetical protein ABIF18_00885 [archaeon]